MPSYTVPHSLHRMTAEYRCVDCNRTESELWELGHSISGYDSAYPPVPKSPRFTPHYATGDEWDTNGRTL